MEAIKAMIHDQDLPMHMWAEAARTTVYVHNKSPHKVLENKTPEEMFSREKPTVNHFRILVALYLFTSPRKRGQSWTLLDKKAYLLVTVTH
jgi:hypothetical protein